MAVFFFFGNRLVPATPLNNCWVSIVAIVWIWFIMFLVNFQDTDLDKVRHEMEELRHAVHDKDSEVW